MIILDANILLYANTNSCPEYEAANKWVKDNFLGEETIGIPWVAVLAFLRITTNPKIYSNPITMIRANEIVDSWFNLPSVVVAQATTHHWKILKDLMTKYNINSRLTTDAHIAALCYEHNASICTNDLDFTRFEGIKIINPVK